MVLMSYSYILAFVVQVKPRSSNFRKMVIMLILCFISSFSASLNSISPPSSFPSLLSSLISCCTPSGPSELCGAVDLISHYKLWPHHDYFCKRSPPLSLSESPYLRNLVGDLQIRKGEGMELGQLLQSTSCTGDRNEHMHPFDLDILSAAFQIKETTAFDLPYVMYLALLLLDILILTFMVLCLCCFYMPSFLHFWMLSKGW